MPWSQSDYSLRSLISAVVICLWSLDPCYDQSLEYQPPDREASCSSNVNMYSASTVAAISVLCTVVSVVAGFFLGLCVSQITRGFPHSFSNMRSSQVDVRAWRSVSAKDITLDPAEHVVHQNPYEAEPVKTFQTFHPYNVSTNLAKNQYAPGRHNFFVNDLKANNSKLANGPTMAETSLQPRRGIYL